jgi:hypothetical protein
VESASAIPAIESFFLGEPVCKRATNFIPAAIIVAKNPHTRGDGSQFDQAGTLSAE